MEQRRRDDRVLAASLAAIGEIIARGTDAVTVRDLAQAAGISERTFYRYFPTKEDCLRPVLQDASRVFAMSLDLHSADGWRIAVSKAFADAAGGAFAVRTRLLLPIIAASPGLEAVWQHETRGFTPSSSESSFAPELPAAQRVPLRHAVGALMGLSIGQMPGSPQGAGELFDRNLALLEAAFQPVSTLTLD